jgi:hypothetical protein
MASEIHTLMQDADNIDAVGDPAVKQDVRAAGDFVVALSYVRAVLSHRRTRRYGLDALPKVVGIRLCLVKSPAVGRVIPNIVKVGLSLERYPKLVRSCSPKIVHRESPGVGPR